MPKFNFLLFLFFCAPFLLVAQIVEDDFEGNGNIISWLGDNCEVDLAFANPFPIAINTSATVLRYMDTGGLYANVRFEVPGGINLAENPAFALKVYIPSSSISGDLPNKISLKVQDGTLEEPWSTQSEIIKPLVLDQWQLVTFDFANDNYINLNNGSPHPVTRSDFNRVVIQVNGENNQEIVTAYLDDVVYGGTTGAPSIYTQLVWADEFEGTGALDPTKWYHQTQLPNGFSWYNNEVQHYTNRTENSYQEDGFLNIVARKETFSDQGHTKEYTSARLNSKFAFTYGRVEVRAKLPTGLGTWPAIWMLGKNITEPGGYWTDEFGTTSWPACGEIDIMEHWGYNQDYIQSALHTPSSSGATTNVGGTLAATVSDVFHVYALEWSPEGMDFSIDGSVYYTYAPAVQNDATWPFDSDQYILLNIAMQPPIAPEFTESPMVIDYVRVYQEEGPTSAVEVQGKYNVDLFPNPVADALNIRVPEELVGAKVSVYAASGKVLVHEFVQESAQTTLDWAAYPAGTYFLTFTTATDQVTYQVVKT